MSVGTQMISGLASGIDWQSMVDQLIAVDAQKIDVLSNKASSQEAKKSAWQDLNGKLDALKTAMEKLADEDSFNLFNTSMTSSTASIEASDILAVTTNTNANLGSFQVNITQTASAEKLSSANFSEIDEALSLSGEFLLEGRSLTIESTDTLADISQSINALNSGNNATGVVSSIITTTDGSYRLMLTAQETGEDGISIQDVSSTDIVQSLGFTDSTTSIKHSTSNGAESDLFGSTQSSIANLLGLNTMPPSNSQVNIGFYQNIEIDLSLSLSQLADSINTQAGASIASISEEETDDGTEYRLKLVGTSYSDSNNVLEALGVLEGNHSSVSEIQTSTDLSKVGGGVIDAATTFAQIDTGSGANNIVDGDTITIQGKDHAGNSISDSFSISTADTLQSLLTEIESVFGAEGNSVTASIDANGKINVSDDSSGESLMEVSLIANNENGGTLDFDDFDIATEGRTMQVEAGSNAEFTVDGMQFSRSSNTITDVLGGVTLSLRSADEDTTVTVNIDRDTSGIRSMANTFVKSYNEVQGFFNQQSSYDEETETTGGVLFGDTTLTTIQSTLLSRIVSTVDGAASDLNTLSRMGITLADQGLLSLDNTEFDDVVASQFNDLVQFFTAQGSTTGSNLSYVNYSSDTEPGTYAVNVTQVAEKATITGTVDLSGGLAGDETMTITDKITGQTATVSLTAGMNTDAIANAINSELMQEYAEVVVEDSGHTKTSAAGGGSVNATTLWNELNTGGDTNDISDGDRIVISGTARNGTTVSGYYDIDDASTDTLQGLLTAIESTFDNDVYAAVDDDGKITITDRQNGVAALDLELSYSGEGSLSFDDFSTDTEGRLAMAVSASNSSENIALTHSEYGSSFGFTITQSSNNLGIADQEYTGQNIAGTIGGEEATGKGQTLTGEDEASSTAGIIVRYTGTSTGSIGTVSFAAGFGEILDRTLYGYTDPYTGYINAKNDAIDDSVTSLNKQIEDQEYRLENTRQSMLKRYLAMEQTISSLQQQQSWLSTQLSSIGLY